MKKDENIADHKIEGEVGRKEELTGETEII